MDIEKARQIHIVRQSIAVSVHMMNRLVSIMTSQSWWIFNKGTETMSTGYYDLRHPWGDPYARVACAGRTGDDGMA